MTHTTHLNMQPHLGPSLQSSQHVLSKQISSWVCDSTNTTKINHARAYILYSFKGFTVKIPDDVQELQDMLVETELKTPHPSSFFYIPLADLNALLTSDMSYLKGSFNARNSFSAKLLCSLSLSSPNTKWNNIWRCLIWQSWTVFT